jgi:hypothetical protein
MLLRRHCGRGVSSSTHGTMNRFMWKAVSHSLVTHRDEAACSDQSSSTTRLARMESCS